MKPQLKLVAFIVTMTSIPALAETYHVGTQAAGVGCHNPLTYEQDPSIHATPLPDVNAPPQPAIDTETLTHPPLALHLPIEPYLNAPAYNVDLSRSDLEIGTLSLNHRGQLRFHNETLSSGASPVYSRDCP